MMVALSKKSAAEYLCTDDLVTQLRMVKNKGAWYVPAHILDEMCQAAANEIELLRRERGDDGSE